MLSEMNCLKSAFYTDLSHEMKTPLTVISVNAQFAAQNIEAGVVDAETVTDLNTISAEAKRLAQMVTSLVGIGRMQGTQGRGNVCIAANVVSRNGELNAVKDKSFQFAVRIVNLYRYLRDEKKEYVLSKQLLRSGTSVGANIEEALQAQSKKDYLSKMNIALKEANETMYWIRLFHATQLLDDTQKESVCSNCDEIIRLLVAIVKTTKKRLGRKDESRL